MSTHISSLIRRIAPTRNRDDSVRGQMTTDFMIGMLLFLGALIVLISLTGGHFTGDALSTADTEPEASRAANYLVDDLLAADQPTAANELSHNQVAAFFDSSQNPTPSDIPLRSDIGVRVVLKPYGNASPPSVFGGANKLESRSPVSQKVTSEVTLTATLDGKTVRLKVQTWLA